MSTTALFADNTSNNINDGSINENHYFGDGGSTAGSGASGDWSNDSNSNDSSSSDGSGDSSSSD